VTKGYKLFQGILSKSDEKSDSGFNLVDAEFQDVNEYEGQTYKAYVKNETLVGWLDVHLDAVSPDYIDNLNPKTAE
jgi:DUF917 family protein